MTRTIEKRVRWMLGCGGAALALSLAVSAEKAQAQAFQASETVVAGSATRIPTGTETETITVETPTAVIDWTPEIDQGTGNALDFLPTGAVATFENDGSSNPGGDFAVLNRILPTQNGDITVIDGSVISRIVDLQLGTSTPGGTIAFYSPTGILVGANASFDVGNLVLTTLEPDVASFEDFVLDGGTMLLDAGDAPTARIEIESGAQITATAENSYFAAIAAGVRMRGTSDVNGSQAYVAGRVVNLTFSNGLFDIEIPVGTALGDTVVGLNGDVGGPSSAEAGDNHMIYAVARAAENPISMLFTGNLGFEPAASADVVNGEIILSANYDVFGRTVQNGTISDGIDAIFDAQPDSLASPLNEANIAVQNMDSSSSLLAIGSNLVEFNAGESSITVDGNLLVVGRERALATAGFGIINVTGDMLVSASTYGVVGSDFPDPGLIDAVGGEARLEAGAFSEITIGGDALVTADAFGGADTFELVAGSATAGVALIGAGEGTVDILGDVTVSASAFGSTQIGLLAADAAVTGGEALIFARDGGALSLGGRVELLAEAFSVPGGDAAGGLALIDSTAEALIGLGGPVFLSATALATGDFETRSIGSADGGVSQIIATNGGEIDVTDSVSMEANGFLGEESGDFLSLGDATAGTAELFADLGGLVTIGGDLFADASASGGAGSTIEPSEVSNGFGGFARVAALGGSSISIGSSVSLSSFAQGGTSNAEGIGSVGDSGEATVFAAGLGTVEIAGDLRLDAVGDGGANAGGTGGTGLGGRASATTFDGSTITVGGRFDAGADGAGGDGVTGGDGFGGIAGAVAGTGLVEIELDARASATGSGGRAFFGFGGDGGIGRGGNSFFQAEGTPSDTARILIGGNAAVDSSGRGGRGGEADGSTLAEGRGGDGIGGEFTTPNQADPEVNSGAFLLAGGDNGTLTIGGQASLLNRGSGGEGGFGSSIEDGGLGGDGFGGLAQFGLVLLGGDGSLGEGSASAALVSIDVEGAGGSGGFSGFDFPTGNGGDGTGGRALVNAQAGAVAADFITLEANGRGGSGALGGDGFGGERSGSATNFGGSLTVGQFNAFARGFGGDSFAGAGGNGTGGEAFMGFQAGTTEVTGEVIVDATGFGGQSETGVGGTGTGGIADLAIFTPSSGTGTIVGNASVVANGIGGDGSEGEVGGDGEGGEAFIRAQAGGTITLGSATVSASGQGGSGLFDSGGNGTGGRAFIESFDADSSVTVQDVAIGDFDGGLNTGALLAAVGVGGDAIGEAGFAGTGTGGEVELFAGTGGLVELPAFDPQGNSLTVILAEGFGGGSAVDGETAGAGIGGTGLIRADGGIITAGQLAFSVVGFGGSSLDAGLDIAGGSGSGGTRTVEVLDGGELTAALAGGAGGGFGGDGSGSGAGGDATGGTTSLTVDNAVLTLLGSAILVDGSRGGSGAVGGDAGGGSIDVLVTNSTLELLASAGGAGSFEIGGQATGGDGISAGGNAAGADSFVRFAESTVSGGSLTVSAQARGGSVTGGDGVGGNAFAGDAFFVAEGSTVELEERLLVSAGAVGGDGALGGEALGAFASVELSASQLTVSEQQGEVLILADAIGGAGDETGAAAGGTAQFLQFAASLDAAALVMDAGASAANESAGGTGGEALGGFIESIVEGDSALGVTDWFMLADAFTSAGGAASGGLSGLVANTGGGPGIDVGGQIVMSASGEGGDANAAGRFFVDALSGTTRTASFAGSALGDAPGDFAESSLTAGGGDLLVDTQLSFEVFGDFILAAESGGFIGGPDPSDPTVAIDITSQGRITFLGDNDEAIDVGGLSMTLAARDIAIESGARIGAVTMEFSSLDTLAPAILGGEGTPSGEVEGEGFTLVAEELARIEAGSFAFFQPVLTDAGGDAPDMILRDATVSGSADPAGGISEILLETFGESGIIRVEGFVEVLNAAPTDSFTLAPRGGSQGGATGRIEVVTPGGIAIGDSDGLPTGELILEAGDIWAGDADLIAALQDDRSFAGRDDQLQTAISGSDDPLGYLRAGQVGIVVGQSLLVRNTGSDTDQGGILVSEGGLSIRADENARSALDVFAYGRRQRPDGTFVTGSDFFSEVEFNAGVGNTDYTEDAAFNDCVILTGECPATVVEPPEPPEPSLPGNETIVETIAAISNPAVIEDPVDLPPEEIPLTTQETDEAFGADFPGLIDTPLLTEEPLLDDPVASGGDSSAYRATGTGGTGISGGPEGDDDE